MTAHENNILDFKKTSRNDIFVKLMKIVPVSGDYHGFSTASLLSHLRPHFLQLSKGNELRRCRVKPHGTSCDVYLFTSLFINGARGPNQLILSSQIRRPYLTTRSGVRYDTKNLAWTRRSSNQITFLSWNGRSGSI